MANTITIDGTLGRDPELSYAASGVALCKFSVANNRRWKDRNDEWQEKTTWFNITVFNDLGENVAQSLTKGDRVIVVGRMEDNSWTDDEGKVHPRMELVADDVAPSLRWATAQVEKIKRERQD